MDTIDKIEEQVRALYFDLDPDLIVVENTVKGRNRTAQRLLEWLHYKVIYELVGFKLNWVYKDPSEWRKIVGMYMSKDDKKNNRDVSKGKKRGRITKKHLSVRLSNELFDLKLKIKDNDIADAILLAYSQF